MWHEFNTTPVVRSTAHPPTLPYPNAKYKAQLKATKRTFYSISYDLAVNIMNMVSFEEFLSSIPPFHSKHIEVQFNSLSWWRHQMETLSALLAICAGNSPVPGEFPTQRPVTRSFDVFFDLRLNIRLSKQSWGWRFETLSRPLWRHCNVAF